jgi:hypothetical protein
VHKETTGGIGNGGERLEIRRANENKVADDAVCHRGNKRRDGFNKAGFPRLNGYQYGNHSGGIA